MINKDISFDKEKFNEVLHYIISEIGGLDTFGKTVLYKMLYFSDFDNYEINEVPITGESYFKLVRGPAPSHFETAISELKKEGQVREYRATRGNHKGNTIKFISLKKPKLDKLSAKELEVIKIVVRKLSGMNATQISEYSHEDIPWKATELNKEIEYEFVFYRDPIFSVTEAETA